MAANIKYLVSGQKNYDDLICSDSGPNYASDLGIDIKIYSRSDLKQDDYYILDPWLTHEEIDDFREKIAAKRIGAFAVRVVDPEAHGMHCRGVNAFAFEMASNPKASLVLAYHPTELTEMLALAYGAPRVHISPYPYVIASERQLSFEKRKKLILISGAQNPVYYPLRSLVRHKRNTSLVWRFMTRDGSHPGWSKEAASSKSRIGDNYIDYLASFQKFLLCPSRLKLEFLKFRECAYAGCCPVGAYPDGFPLEGADAFLPLSIETWNKDVERIRSVSVEECLIRAESYRAALRMHRSADRLRTQLFEFAEFALNV